MNFCDLHCDTPLELFYNRGKIKKNSLHISLEKAGCFDKYVQCAAVWSDKRFSDGQCFDNFLSCAGYFRESAGDMLCTSPDELSLSDRCFILSIEDARLLCGKLSRLGLLYEAGVRILTLVWKDSSIIGGAWNTNEGLTEFGREVAEQCFEAGIIPDVSHASTKVIKEVSVISAHYSKPFIASHSCSYDICRNSRNINRDCLRAVVNSGGIVGMSIYPAHINGTDFCTSDDILRHVAYFVNTCGSDSIAFGCDFDGIDKTPEDIKDLSCIPLLYDKTVKMVGSSSADKIFFSNAYNFLLSNI